MAYVVSGTRFRALRARGAREAGFFFTDQFFLPRRFQRGIARPWAGSGSSFGSAGHISLDLNVRGCVKFDSILMRNVTKIGVSSSFGVLGSIKQKLIFLTQNQLHKVIFLESDKT